jgi:hypothetical protein
MFWGPFKYRHIVTTAESELLRTSFVFTSKLTYIQDSSISPTGQEMLREGNEVPRLSQL